LKTKQSKGEQIFPKKTVNAGGALGEKKGTQKEKVHPNEQTMLKEKIPWDSRLIGGGYFNDLGG